MMTVMEPLQSIHTYNVMPRVRCWKLEALLCKVVMSSLAPLFCNVAPAAHLEATYNPQASPRDIQDRLLGVKRVFALQVNNLRFILGLLNPFDQISFVLSPLDVRQ